MVLGEAEGSSGGRSDVDGDGDGIGEGEGESDGGERKGGVSVSESDTGGVCDGVCGDDGVGCMRDGSDDDDDDTCCC